MSASSPLQSRATPAPPDITALLLARGAGDHTARHALLPAAYAALHAQAATARKHEAAGHALSTSASRQWVAPTASLRRVLGDDAA